jgi:hypothetical protein
VVPGYVEQLVGSGVVSRCKRVEKTKRVCVQKRQRVTKRKALKVQENGLSLLHPLGATTTYPACPKIIGEGEVEAKY